MYNKDMQCRDATIKAAEEFVICLMEEDTPDPEEVTCFLVAIMSAAGFRVVGHYTSLPEGDGFFKFELVQGTA